MSRTPCTDAAISSRAARSCSIWIPSAAPPRRQVGQDPPARLLHLLEQCPPLVLGPRDDRLALGHRVGEDALALDPRLLLGVGHEELHLDHPLGRRGLGARLELVDLALRLAQQGGGALLGLGHDLGRLLVGVAQDLCAVLAQRRGERRLVDHRVGRPLLGLGQGGPQLLLALLERLDAPGHRLEVGPHLVGVEAPPDDGEGVAGDVPGRDAGGGDGGAAFWHGQSLRRRLDRHRVGAGTLPPSRFRIRSTWSRLLTA